MNIETPTVELTLSERNQRAATMKRRGLPYQVIADTLGIALSTAYGAVESAMKEIPFEDADTLRKIELAHLEIAQAKALEILEVRHVLADIKGKLIYDEDGNVATDDTVALKAIDSLTKIQTRRSKLLGLDAPLKSMSLVAVVTLDEMKQDIDGLFDRLKDRELVEG